MTTTLPATQGRRATRPLAFLLSLALILLAAIVAGSTPASAASERIVIADVHTDAVSTFWDDGHLVLASKADTPTLHTRYEAEDVWFHVDDDSRIDGFPAGYEFVAPAGTTVWLAPEVQQPNQIWPGFSTESVPSGVLDNDDITLTLVGVDGPGDVELWQTGSFGAAQRLWSSDEAAYKSFTRKTNVHMHANWAFTRPASTTSPSRPPPRSAGSPSRTPRRTPSSWATSPWTKAIRRSASTTSPRSSCTASSTR